MVAKLAFFFSKLASMARKRSGFMLLRWPCRGGARGPWSMRPRQQIPSDDKFRPPLSPAKGLALLRSTYKSVRALSSSFSWGSSLTSAWRWAALLPQVASSQVEAAASTPASQQPSVTFLELIAFSRIFVGCFM
jgi:hypothetical protein